MSGIEVLGAVSSAITVVDTAVKTVGYLCDVYNAPADRTTLIVEISQLKALLDSLKVHLSNQERMDCLHSSFSVPEATDFIKAVEDLTSCVLEITAKVPTRAAPLDRLKWPFSSAKIKESLAKMERMKTLIGLVIASQHSAISMTIQKSLNDFIKCIEPKYSTLMKRLDQKVDEMHQGVKHIEHSVNCLMDAQATAEHERLCQSIRQWLTPSWNIESELRPLQKLCAPGSGEWLTSSKEMEDWIGGKRQLYLLRGAPGSGKTVLSYIVHTHLKNVRKYTTLTVFISYASKLSISSILARLAAQLIDPSSEVPHELRELYRKHSTRVPSEDELRTALTTIVKERPSPTFLVVDALDEFLRGEKSELVDVLLDLACPIFITTRPISDNVFGMFPFFSHFLSESHHGDLAKCIGSGVSDLPVIRGISENKKDDFSDQVLAASNGLFLLASLHLRFLRHARNIRTFRDKLAVLPRTPDERYADSICRITQKPKWDCELALHTLMWVWVAKRPLELQALREAVACTTTSFEGGSEDCIEEALTNGSELLDLCDGLVVEGDHHVRLVHFTAQSYFDAVGEHVFKDLLPSVAPGCLGFIRAPRSPPAIQKLKDLARNPWIISTFFVYCAEHWGDHASSANEDLTSRLFIELCEDTAMFNISSRMRARRMYADWFTHGNITLPSPLHIVISFGLAYLLPSLLLANTASPNSLDARGQTPLIYAIQMKQVDAVNVLISLQNIDINAKATSGMSPLGVAVQSGYLEIVKALFSRDNLEVDCREENGSSLLSLATRCGYLDIVQVFLARKDVDADSRDGQGRSPLFWATRCGYLNIVQDFLAREDVDANSRDEQGRSPLFWATLCGYLDIVRVFLAREDIEADFRDVRGQSPLSLASLYGYLDIVQAFLARDDVDADPRDDQARSPLFWAARCGHLDVVQVFLAREDVDADSRDAQGQSPLFLAVLGGHLKMVQALLSREDVDPNFRDAQGCSLLTWACKKRYPGIAKALLARADVDPNSRDNQGRSSLCYAALEGHLEVVRALLSRRDMDPESRDSDGYSPLSFAASRGHLDIVQVLLARSDVDANHQDILGRSALFWACQQGHLNVVRAFLATEDVIADCQDSKGRSPISWVAQWGYVNIVQALLDRKDVDPNSRDQQGRCPLSFAAAYGHLRVVETLLARGEVDPNSRENGGSPPLAFASCKGHLAVVLALLAKQEIIADPYDFVGRSPLILASGWGHHDIVDALLARDDIDSNHQDNQGRSALSWAAGMGNSGIVQVLLAQGEIDANSRDKQGRSPLLWAVANGNLDIVELLLSRDDVDVNSCDNRGLSPCAWAEREGYEEIFDALNVRGGVVTGPVEEIK